MCLTQCNDPRCALFEGPVMHEGVVNPSAGRVEVKYIECYNIELQRQANNIVTAPVHNRALNYCPPKMTSAVMGVYDPPQPPICF